MARVIIFIIFRLVLWISSFSWLNVESVALSKVILVIWRGSKDIYVLRLFAQNVMLWAKLFGRPHYPLNPSQFNKHS